jgi:peroxiredoxin
MEQVLREHRARGLALLAVNIEEDRETVARWARAKKVTSTLLLDPTGSVNRAYRVTGTPTVFVVGRDGRLVAKAVSTMPWTGPEGRAFLQALLAR